MQRPDLLRTLLTLAAVALVSAGCDSVLSRLSGAYDGPLPAREDIHDEVVVVYDVTTYPDTGIRIFLADRVRFTADGRPHDVNRVVRIYPREMQDQVAALNVEAGDTLRVSTQFLGIGEAAGPKSIPNWPGHKAYEYPIGEHRLTAVAKP